MADDSARIGITYRGVNLCITDACIVHVPAQLQNNNEPLAAGDRIIVSNINSGIGIALQRDLDLLTDNDV
jgi:hypothetical protein